MKFQRLLLVLASGLGLTLVMLCLLGRPLAVRANPGTLYVAPDGSDATTCDSVANRCRTVQRAVDVAIGGDEIRVATGVYTDIQARAGMTQVVYISGTVTIRGGYDAGFSTWDPDTYPTTLDPQGLGRVVRIFGNITPTLEGLRLTNGVGSPQGGGIYVQNAHPVISACHVYSNTAAVGGGGIYLSSSPNAVLTGNRVYSNAAGSDGGGVSLETVASALLTDNAVYSNRAGQSGGGIRCGTCTGALLTRNDVYSNTAQSGGGLYLLNSFTVTVAGNNVFSNTASMSGGGVHVINSPNATLTGNAFYGNATNQWGGGAYLHDSGNATLTSNDVYLNTAQAGGGISLAYSDGVALTGNRVYRNAASQGGGGIHLSQSHAAALTSNAIYSNTAQNGGGFYSGSSLTITLTGNQIYSNTAGQRGGGISLSSGDYATLASNQVYSNAATGDGGGLFFSANHTATLANNTFFGNTGDRGGGCRIDGSNNVTLTNNVAAGNRITGGYGAGVLVLGANIRLLHTTLARNNGGNGSGIYLTDWSGEYSTAALTNTVLVSQTIGVYVNTGSTATLQATLWGAGAWANGTDVSGAGSVVSGTNLYGDPAFVDYGAGDYHITGASAARDAGVSTSVGEDIDGDARPFGVAPDLGADETICLVRLNGVYYPTVQAAVDASASPGDVVQVAGACQGVQTRASMRQMAYISKTLTLRGGYSADFTWNPRVYTTTLDAQGQGRVLVINGSVTPTVEGFVLTNGNASDMAVNNGRGGGIFSSAAGTTIVNNIIVSNIAYITTGIGYGGGVYLVDASASALISGNLIIGNTANPLGQGRGGGLAMYSSPTTVRGNIFRDNVAGFTANSQGGGLWLSGSPALVSGNRIERNNATGFGGGLYSEMSASLVTLDGNTVVSNTANNGGGLYLSSNTFFTMTNNVVAQNSGNGVYLRGNASFPLAGMLVNNSVAQNGSQGVYLNQYATVALTNTILVSHTVGIIVGTGCTATLEATLWGSGMWANGDEWSGGQVLTSTDVYGSPAFVAPDDGDYHLGAGSAAFERGVSTWVHNDIDGDLRSIGLGMQPDLGADEALPVLAVAKSGPAWHNSGELVTYTLSVTNTGVVTAHRILLSDVLPSGATFVEASDSGEIKPGSDTVTWFLPALGLEESVVTRTFTVTATDTIVNQEYGVSSFGTPVVSGTVAITTQLNHAPTADAGAPQSVSVNALVTLDGSTSFDPDGDPLIYRWQQTGGASVTLSNLAAVSPTFTSPSTADVLTFSLTVTDTLGVAHSDTTSVVVTNIPPALTLSKSGPAQAKAGEIITYTLVVSNSAAVGASSLVITDALPAGATFISAGSGGLRVGNVISWTVPDLRPMERLTRTLAVTATATITNAHYRVSCAEGTSVTGNVSVVIQVNSGHQVYLPLVMR